MNARPLLSQVEIQAQSAEQRLSRRPVRLPHPPVAVPRKSEQAGFYRWLLGWLVLAIMVACIRLALAP